MKELFVDIDWVRRRLASPRLRLVDYGPERREFDARHLPGALLLSLETFFDEQAGSSSTLPSVERMVGALRAAGIGFDDEVVFYDARGGIWAARACWALRYLGHPRAHLLAGGIRGSLRASIGAPETQPCLRTKSRDPTVSAFPFHVEDRLLVDTDWVATKLDDPTVLFVDTRSRGEYAGRKGSAPRGGHIPGAVHLHWKSLFHPSRGYRLRDFEGIEALFARSGIRDRELTVVSYCESGVTAALAWAVLESLGFPDNRLYVGSWSVYASRPALPIATGPSARGRGNPK